MIQNMPNMPLLLFTSWTSKVNGKFDHCLVADRLPSCKTEGDIAALKDFADLIYTGE